MATLEEKYLDGPNVGYCSDSDEEPEPQPSSDYPKNPPGSGKAGAKGVLEDYRAHQEAKRQAFVQAERNLVKEALRFTLSSSERQNEQKSDEDEEDELEAIRKRRMEHLQNRNNARITEIHEKSEFLNIIEATTNGSLAIIHIYRNDLEASDTLNESLMDLAAQSKNCGFFKVQAKVLEMSTQFSRNGLPALQVYGNTKLVGNFVRITDTLTEDFDSRDLKRLLAENDIVLEARN
ncbi:Phosducin domain-containing protein [Aphelenchoides bicaudatus]|nr:Phosducin domain-containing protein [Aphelenchoides bicaudatus]